MRIRTLAGALAMSGVVAASLPADAAPRHSRSGGHDRGYASRSYSGRSYSSRSYAPRSYSSRSYSGRSYSSRSYSYGYRDRGRSYRSYGGYRTYRSYRPRISFSVRPYLYSRYAYNPYVYDDYAYDPYGYGYEPYAYGYDPYAYNGPYPRYRSRGHYHGRLFCVRPHLSVHIGF
jgi:hypothetical protein